MNTRKVNEFKLLGLAAVFYSAIMAMQVFQLYRESNTTPLKGEYPAFYLMLSIGFLLLLVAAIIGLAKGKRFIVFFVLGLTSILTLIEIFYLR